MIYTPRPYQIIMQNHILDHPRSALFAQMGLGKTVATLTALDMLSLIEPGPILIVAPLRVALSVWSKEVLKWDHLQHLTCSIIVGDKATRLAAMRAKADIYCINYDCLVWFIDTCLELKMWKWTKIVCDESTKLKGYRTRQGGKRAKALSRAAWHPKVTRFVCLTGTPSPNGLQDLFGQLYFLDRGERLGKSYSAFMNRWFYKPFLNAFNFIPHAHAQKEIENAVKDICLALKTEDWFTLDKVIEVDVPVYLPDEAMKLYKKMEKELFFEINSKEVEALSAAAMSMKCLQIASGAVYTDDQGNWETVHDGKLDALEDVIEEAAGAPVIVVYYFKSDLARLKRRFKQGVELGKDPATIERWSRGEIPILWCHSMSAGHGIDLSYGNTMVFFSHDWNLENFQQICERIGAVRQLAAGHPRPITLFNLRAVGTIDSVVISRRENKKRVQDLLLEAAKYTPT